MKLIKNNSIIIGVIVGLVLPLMIIGVIFIIGILTGQPNILIVSPKLYMLSVIGNLIFIRLYFLNWKLEKSGAGIILISFIEMIFFFLYFIK